MPAEIRQEITEVNIITHQQQQQYLWVERDGDLQVYKLKRVLGPECEARQHWELSCVRQRLIWRAVPTKLCSVLFQDKRAVERLDVEKVYHPFIAGPYNKLVSELMQDTGTRINIPPPSVNKTEIVFTGEKEQLAQAVARVKKIYEEKVWMVYKASYLPHTLLVVPFPFLFYFSCILLVSALAQQPMQYTALDLTISSLSRVRLG